MWLELHQSEQRQIQITKKETPDTQHESLGQGSNSGLSHTQLASNSQNKPATITRKAPWITRSGKHLISGHRHKHKAPQQLSHNKEEEKEATCLHFHFRTVSLRQRPCLQFWDTFTLSFTGMPAALQREEKRLATRTYAFWTTNALKMATGKFLSSHPGFTMMNWHTLMVPEPHYSEHTHESWQERNTVKNGESSAKKATSDDHKP